jgi:RHS repeat-associated protein
VIIQPVTDISQLTAKILQQNNYYAFGASIKSLEPFVTMPKNEYLYNGKELQEETGYYDYGARHYDPLIGRWNVIDLLAEKSRNSYAFDNPIILPIRMECIHILLIFVHLLRLNSLEVGLQAIIGGYSASLSATFRLAQSFTGLGGAVHSAGRSSSISIYN